MAHKRSKRYRIYGAAVLGILAALLFVYLSANQDDYYRRTLQPESFTAVNAGETGGWQSERLMLEKAAIPSPWDTQCRRPARLS